MAELKTKRTEQDPKEFLRTVEPEEKQKDSFKLLKIFQDATSEKPAMWGTAIVGYGMYHYKSTRSTQEGDWPLVGFSPRKQNLTLYVMLGMKDNPLLKKLGKYKASGGCLYIKKLVDVDQAILAKLIKTSFEFAKKKRDPTLKKHSGLQSRVSVGNFNPP
jgi:Domain of unknown function (DU1801)